MSPLRTVDPSRLTATRPAARAPRDPLAEPAARAWLERYLADRQVPRFGTRGVACRTCGAGEGRACRGLGESLHPARTVDAVRWDGEVRRIAGKASVLRIHWAPRCWVEILQPGTCGRGRGWELAPLGLVVWGVAAEEIARAVLQDRAARAGRRGGAR